ncbi:MAG TPA: hypothetical protein VHG51_18570 [Longimicrobiaceae bacterium]|nr:hypothetical protein [Longimicrobiaceae bacterium]
MEDKQFEVDVVYRATVRYAVTAPDRETAERLAEEMWQAEEEGVGGTEVCELEEVHAVAELDAEGCGRDCEQVLRYLRDRELVIERLDADAFNPTIHDAVSAEEVARHLAWAEEGGELDVARAIRALERLCDEHRVVCFSRPRVRSGERGEIRLYCTPQHLERLSALLVEPALEDAEALAQPAPEVEPQSEPAAAGQA